jgi:hypothetical protein
MGRTVNHSDRKTTVNNKSCSKKSSTTKTIHMERRSWGLDFLKTRETTRGFAICIAKVTGKDDGSRKGIQGVLLSLFFLRRRHAYGWNKRKFASPAMGSFLIHIMGRKDFMDEAFLLFFAVFIDATRVHYQKRPNAAVHKILQGLFSRRQWV